MVAWGEPALALALVPSPAPFFPHPVWLHPHLRQPWAPVCGHTAQALSPVPEEDGCPWLQLGRTAGGGPREAL